MYVAIFLSSQGENADLGLCFSFWSLGWSRWVCAPWQNRCGVQAFSLSRLGTNASVYRGTWALASHIFHILQNGKCSRLFSLLAWTLWQHGEVFLVSCVDTLGPGKVSTNLSSNYGGGLRCTGSLRSRLYCIFTCPPCTSGSNGERGTIAGSIKDFEIKQTNPKQQDGYKFLVNFLINGNKGK